MARDKKVESVLHDFGVAFTYIDRFDLSKINRAASRRNQARVGSSIIADVAIGYAEAMVNGAEFPPIVLYPHQDQFIVVEGNHRDEAASLADKTHLSAYVLNNATPKQIELLTYLFNTMNGLPTTVEERMLQAMRLVESGAVTRKEAARLLSIPEGKLAHAINKERTERRLRGLGIKLDSLPQYALSRLANVQSDVVLQSVANIASRARLKTEDINNIVGSINKARSEAEQLQVVADFKATHKDDVSVTAGGHVKYPKELTAVFVSLSRIETVAPEKLKGFEYYLTDEMKARLIRQAERGISILEDVYEYLKGD